jgi:microcystin-dependent protein
MDIDLIEKKIRELQILLGPGGLAAHAALTGSAAHGAVSAPTPDQIITRDGAGRAQVVAPSVAADIARKDTVDAVQTNLGTHTALTTAGVHGSTVAATADKLVHRDASGRSQVATPAAAADIARKDTVDAVQTNLANHAALTNPHSAVAAPTADRMILRDAAGRAQVVNPSVAADIATKGYADGLAGSPTGAILMWGTATPPTGWLMCNGASVSEATYAALFAVIGHGFGPGGPTDPGGGNFYLPDFQGISPTGPGSQNINTRSKTGPALGYTREDQGQGHYHDLLDANSIIPRYGGGGDRTLAVTGTVSNQGWSKTGSPITDGVNGTPRNGAYTHGPEIGVNFIIKT